MTNSERLDLRNFKQPQYPMRRICVQTGRIKLTRKREDVRKRDSIAQEDIHNDDKLTKLMSFGEPTALFRTAESGREDVVWLLLTRSDVEADRRDIYGRTALWYAVVNGHETITKNAISSK